MKFKYFPTFLLIFFIDATKAQEVTPEVVSQILQNTNIAGEIIAEEEEKITNEDLSIDLQKSGIEIEPSPVFGINF